MSYKSETMTRKTLHTLSTGVVIIFTSAWLNLLDVGHVNTDSIDTLWINCLFDSIYHAYWVRIYLKDTPFHWGLQKKKCRTEEERSVFVFRWYWLFVSGTTADFSITLLCSSTPTGNSIVKGTIHQPSFDVSWGTVHKLCANQKNRSIVGSLLRKCALNTAYERLFFQATISSGLFHYVLWKPQYWGLNKSLFVSVPCCESILCLRVICSIRPLNMNILQCLKTTTLGFPFNAEFSARMIHDRYFTFAIFP